MNFKVSGLIFLVSACVFAVTAALSKQLYFYGIALMCFAVALFLIFGDKPKAKRAAKQKGRFEA